MEGKVSAIHTFSKITPLQKLNDNFTLAECTVCGCGKNRNYSYISQETIEKELYGLNYLPIVAHLIEKEDGTGVFVGGHDYTIDENWNFKPLTQVVGCVVNDSFEFRDIEEYGETVKYLVCKCILYTEHIPELMSAIYSEDTYFGESMEIEVKQSRPLEEDSNYQEILDFSFLKLCLLGMSDNPDEHTEPCFISSKVYKSEDFELSNFDDVMLKLKEQCANYFALREKGGSTMDDNKEMNLDNIDEPTVDTEAQTVVDKTIQEFIETDKHPVTVETVNDIKSGKEAFALTYNQKYDVLSQAVDALDNDMTWHWLKDFDDKYLYVERHDVGGVRELYRVVYTLDESNGDVAIGSEWVHMNLCWLTDDEVASIDALRNEVTELREFKKNVEEQAHIADCDSVLDEFSDLNRFEIFKDLKSKAYSYSADELRKECFAIRGQYGTAKTAKVGLPANQKSANYVDEFFNKYLHK